MANDAHPKLSFVVPVYNERESLVELHEQLDAATAPLGTAEFLFIDDGSTDGSWECIAKLAASDPRVTGIRFRRNFGKAAALAAGFRQCKGEIVFTMDADLQDDPAEVPHFLSKLNEGFDVVSGWKKIRHDPWHKVFPSRVFNSMVSRKTGVLLHDHNCGYKAIRREVLNSLALYGERHRFVPVLAAAAGFRIGEVVIKHRKREFGKSKYGWNRFLRGYLDLLTVSFLAKYRDRPMHFYGSQYLLLLALGAACLIPGTALIALFPAYPSSYALVLLGGLFVLGASQFYLAGLKAESSLDRNPPQEPYNVAEMTPRNR